MNNDAASHLNLWFAQGSHRAAEPSDGAGPGVVPGVGGPAVPGGDNGAAGPTGYGAAYGYPAQAGGYPVYAAHAQPQGQPQATDFYYSDPNQQHHHYNYAYDPQQLQYAAADALFHTQQAGDFGQGPQQVQQHQPQMQQQGPMIQQAEEPAPVAAPTKKKPTKKRTSKKAATESYGDGAEPVPVNNDGSIPLSRAAFKTVCKYCCMKKDEDPNYQMGVFHKGKCTNPLDPEHGSRWLSLRCKSCAKDVCTSSEIYKRHQCPPGYPSPMPGKSYRTHRRKKEDDGDIDDIDQYWTEPGLSANAGNTVANASGIAGPGAGVGVLTNHPVGPGGHGAEFMQVPPAQHGQPPMYGGVGHHSDLTHHGGVVDAAGAAAVGMYAHNSLAVLSQLAGNQTH
ncbi:hypothetical protein BC830DRAFT_1094566 [Chytriomyces sp. MP71]|nr:hypothetical protein BC830DRAFT_1094566 [Chytriomyces sp. MP71]